MVEVSVLRVLETSKAIGTKLKNIRFFTTTKLKSNLTFNLILTAKLATNPTLELNLGLTLKVRTPGKGEI